MIALAFVWSALVGFWCFMFVVTGDLAGTMGATALFIILALKFTATTPHR